MDKVTESFVGDFNDLYIITTITIIKKNIKLYTFFLCSYGALVDSNKACLFWLCNKKKTLS